MDPKKNPNEPIYKATLRVPTKQQYAYIELSMEGTASEIVNKYLYFTDVYKRAQEKWDKEGLPF